VRHGRDHQPGQRHSLGLYQVALQHPLPGHVPYHVDETRDVPVGIYETAHTNIEQPVTRSAKNLAPLELRS
jgi:hypothetical protein